MITVIVNPVAGSGLAREIGREVDEVLNQRGVPHETRLTEREGHATELARAAAQIGVKTVLSVGGDGTLREVAAGLIGSQTALGIVPAGTGNDFIKALGTPKSWEAALDFALSHPARPVDTGRLNALFFANVCGAGFDVMVLDYALQAKARVRGIWPYLYGVIRAIKNFRPFDMKIEIGEDTFLEGKYMLCTIANGQVIGGGIPIMPAAIVNDGLFDILVVDPLPRWKIPLYLPAILGGTLMNKKISHHYRATRCTLSSPGMRVNVDGEVLPIESARFEIMPGSLLVHW